MRQSREQPAMQPGLPRRERRRALSRIRFNRQRIRQLGRPRRRRTCVARVNWHRSRTALMSGTYARQPPYSHVHFWRFLVKVTSRRSIDFAAPRTDVCMTTENLARVERASQRSEGKSQKSKHPKLLRTRRPQDRVGGEKQRRESYDPARL